MLQLGIAFYMNTSEKLFMPNSISEMANAPLRFNECSDYCRAIHLLFSHSSFSAQFSHLYNSFEIYFHPYDISGCSQYKTSSETSRRSKAIQKVSLKSQTKSWTLIYYKAIEESYFTFYLLKNTWLGERIGEIYV